VESLPGWLIPLPDAASMRAIDRWAIGEQGVPGLDLMERAGAAVARAVEELAPDGEVAIVCGKGNNGGDGLVVARLLREAGRSASVVCVAPPWELAGDARANLERLTGPAPVKLGGGAWRREDAGARAGDGAGREGAGDSAVEARQGPLAGCSAVVDALLGTGFEGRPRDDIAQAIDAINEARAPVVSVDVPSGVDASTGVVAGAAVRAAATVTFHAAKPGLWIAPGKEHAGEVRVADIGIPRGAPLSAPVGLLTSAALARLPTRAAGWTKFTSGHVVVAGGSRGLAGAPQMTARASMRAGAGYVTLCVTRSLQDAIAAAGWPELMTRGLPEEDGEIAPAAAEDVLRATERGGALALGPGLGRGAGAVAFARELARRAEVATVLDADGLNAHARRLGDLAARTAPTVLTPHAGELARLLDSDSAAIERERLRHACEAAAHAQAVVVLKGDDSLIADPGGRTAVSPGGSPALATAGTGDVLTGVIAALLSRGIGAFEAACAGVWLHAEAGREAARLRGGVDGVVASDVIEALAAVRGAGVREGGR
jgi:hydroxyethylthiazole kinase-like uncharacterized protein yjeF